SSRVSSPLDLGACVIFLSWLSPRCHVFLYSFFFLLILRPPSSTLFPYTTLFRSHRRALGAQLVRAHPPAGLRGRPQLRRLLDRVGQRRAPADRAVHRAGRGPRPMTDTAASDAGLPAAFADIADDFHSLSGRDPLQLLLD